MYEYSYIDDLLKLAQEHKKSIAEIVVLSEAEEYDISVDAVKEKMDERIKISHESIVKGLEDATPLKMIEREDRKMEEMQPLVLGEIAHRVVTYALAVSEGNAKMHRVVACPTAGSCGIMPAVTFAVGEIKKATQQNYRDAYFTAAGIGKVIARNACVAGAVGGCQAECGAASAMAAGGVVALLGGTNEQMMESMTMALKNVLGLTCDPIAGLVEVPCVKRNGFFAVHALTAAEMAMAGIKSAVPADQVIRVMYETGRSIPVSLRETSTGGLARTEAAKKIRERLHME